MKCIMSCQGFNGLNKYPIKAGDIVLRHKPKGRKTEITLIPNIKILVDTETFIKNFK